MRVLELTCEPILYGGQEAFIFNFLENLNSEDIKVDVATLYYCENTKYTKIANKKGFHIYELNLEFRPGKSRRLIKKPLLIFLKNHNYDLIHIHSGSISALAYSAEMARKAGVNKVIVHSHSTGVDNLKHKLIQSYFGRRFLKNVNIYCACSAEAGEMKFPKQKWDEIVVLNNGINLSKFLFVDDKRTDIRNRLNINTDSYVIGQVGRFTFEKNQEYTVKLSNIICKNRSDIYFVFIGDGELKEQIMSQVENEKQVIFLNSCDNIWDYYNAFDLLLLPSIYEGIPLVSIEAQANGLPIIASDGVSDEIEINSNVDRLELSDVDKWVKVITERQFKRVYLSTENRIIDSKWDINHVTRKMTNMYKELG